MLSDELLKILPAFSNTETTLIDDQSVNDIIKAIQSAQKFYSKDYEKIYPYFVGRDPIETARNVWDFLKHNIDYVIEPDSLQTIKSPAAIIATGKRGLGGNDCKNFALFTGGILNAYRDNELKDFDLYFRFASYDNYEDTPQHVFVVMVINNKEIWVDAVLDKFNEHKQPSYYIDKKIKPMALVALSGMRRLGDGDGGGYEGGYDYGSDYDTPEDYSGDETDTSGDSTTDEAPLGYYTDDDGDFVDEVGNVYDPSTGDYKGYYDDDGDFVDTDNQVFGSDGENKGYYDSDGDFVDLDNQVYGTDGEFKGYYDSDGDFVDLDNQVYGSDGELKGKYNPDGTYTDLDGNIYDPGGNLTRSAKRNAPAKKPAPSNPGRTSSGSSGGGGGTSGGGASGGGSSSGKPSEKTPQKDPLASLLTKLPGLFNKKAASPIKNPKASAKVSNTGTYLLIGGAALIALFLTRKKK